MNAPDKNGAPMRGEQSKPSAQGGDAIARSKRILALVDDYHDRPTNDTRSALRHALMDEFTPPPAGGGKEALSDAERKSLNAKVADTLRPFLKPGQKVIWREPFRWHDDNGVLSNHYDGMNVTQLAYDFDYEVEWEFCMRHAAIVTPRESVTGGAP